MMINKTLKEYIENNIIPKYENLDLAHRSDHVYGVIKHAIQLGKNYNLNLEMVYVIAAFHDIGLLIERKYHHIHGGIILEKDEFINSYFNIESIKIMKEAIEDHRASSEKKPRSIYGMVITEADRSDDFKEIIGRCFLFELSKNKNTTYNESFERVYDHITKKYGENGYLKVWLEKSSFNLTLKLLRQKLANKEKFKKECLIVYKNIKQSNIII